MDTKGVFKKVVNLVTLSSFLLWNLAAATPEGGQVVAGNAQISQTQNQTVINQSSQSAVINWNGFNTAANESVQFNQPNSSAIALNKINSGLPTNFNGSLLANGQVWIVNPAGVLFGSTANVNVAGLLASTHTINNSDFMSGQYNFAAPSNLTASIINNGNITVADSGIVALVAPYVVNNGVIQANLGKVALSTGGAFVLDLYGDSLINFGSNSSISNGSVENNGLIEATGGKVLMTANAAAGLLDSVISMSGAIKATTATTGQHGEIILNGGHAGKVKVSGKLETSSKDGFVETSGAYVDLDPNVDIITHAWLLDPLTINLSSYGSTVQNILNAGTNVTLSTGVSALTSGTGNIAIDQTLTWSGTAVLTLAANHNITVSNNITATSGGGIVLHADFGGTAGGTVNFTGGAKINVSGPATIYYYPGTTPGTANYSTPTNFNSNFLGTLPTVYMAIDSTADLATLASQSLIAGVNTANYNLANNVTYAGTAAIFPTDGSSNGFAGIFDGHNYVTGTNNTISGINITASAGNTPSGSSEAAFTGRLMSTGVVKDVNFSGNITNGISSTLIGGVAGLSEGLISNVNYTGTINTTSQLLIWQGGLAGILNTGTISGSSFSGTVQDSGGFGAFGSLVGGLVGQTNGSSTISRSAVLTGSAVIGSQTLEYIGGLVGGTAGGLTISNSYSQANVSGSSHTSGGIIAAVSTAPNTFTNVYNSGNVTGSTFGSIEDGAIIGHDYTGTASLTGAYYNSTNCPSCSTTYGGSALTTAQMQVQGNFSGYNFANIWTMSGSSPFFPVLQSTANTTSTNTVLGTGSLSLGAIQSIAVYVNGVLSSTVTSNGAGAFAFIYNADLFGLQTFLATTNSSIPGAILNKINVTGPSFISGLNITLGQVTVDNSAGSGTLSNSDLIVASGPTTPYTNSGNNITLGSGVGFATTAAAPYVLNGNITASGSGGDITFGGTVTLATNAILSSDFGNVTFNNTINGNGSGPWDLTINDNTSAGNPPPTGPGVVTFNGIVGGSNPLNSLTVDSSFGVVMNTSAISTILTQSYNPNVIFSPTVYLYSPALNLTGSNINFNNSVVINHNLANPNALTITGNMAAAQNAAFRTTTGGFGFVGSLHVTGTSLLGGGVGTQNTQTYDGNVTVTTTGSAFFSSDNTDIIFNSTLKGTGSNTLNFFTTNGATTFNGQVGIAGNGSALSISNLAITANTININTPNIYTNVSQTYTGAISLLQDATLTTYTGGQTFSTSASTINSSGAAHDLTISAPSGTARFDGRLGNTQALRNVSVTASAIDIRTPQISTTLTQNYTGNMTINNVGLITFTGSTVQFNSPVNSSGTAAQIQIDGDFVMANTASIGQSSNVGQLIVLNGNSASIRGNITTTGDTTFTGPVTLTADTFITDTGTGIFFDSTVDSDAFGPWGLTLNATVGPVEFDDNVGATNALKILNVTAGNGIVINPNISSNPVLSIITTNDQTYNGNIQLTTTYTSPGTVPSDILKSNSGNITLNGPVSLIYPGGEVSLFMNAANNVYINNSISMNPTPNSPGEGGYLDVTAGNKIYINTSTIEVGSAGDSNTPVPILRSLDFHSPVLLQQDLTITSSSWGHVMIHSTIDTDPLALSEHSLTMIAPTLVDIYGSMGVNRSLSAIDIQTAVLRFLGNGSFQFITTGNQTYSQTQFDSLFTAIVLAATDITFTSSNNGLVSIIGGLHSFLFSTSLQINGNAYLKGNNFANPNFYTDGLFFSIFVTGDTELDNAIIQTKLSNQFYQGNVTVTDNGASLSTIAAVIEFGGNVNSVTGNNSAALSLSTPFDGYTQFDGIVNVGAGTDPLASLTMSDPIRFNGSTFNIDNFTFASAIGITSLGGVVNPSTLVTFNNTIDGISVGNAGNLIVNGNAAINGTIGGSQPLFRLYVSGTTQLGADVSTYGDTEFGGAVILTSNSIITDTGTGIFFDSTIDSDAFGPWSLTTNATAGPVEYDSDIGLSQPLNVLDTTAATGIYFNDKPAQQDVMVINTVGSQIYNGDIVLRPLSTINPTTVTLTASNAGADITFNGKITVPYVAGMYIRLYVNAANNVNINDDVLLAPTPCLGNFFCGGYLDVTAGNVINIDAANLEGGSAPVGFTLHSFAFNSPIILFQSVVNVLGVGVADFNSSINSDSSVVGGTALSFDTYDVTTFGGQMGTAVNGALASLSIAANPVTSLRFTAGANAITTIGNQDLHPPVFYFGNAGMTFTSQSGIVHFYAENTAYYPTGRTAIDTNYTSGYVHVNGDVIFDGDIIPLISANPFNEFSLAGPVIVTGTTEINNGSTIDAQSQDYQQAVTLDGGTVRLNSTGLIQFGSTVDSVSSPTSLIINGVGFTFLSPGSVQMNGAVGSVMPLNNLDVTASILFGAFIYLNTPSITTTGDQLYHGNVALQTNVDAPGMVAGGNIIFDSRIDNGFNLTANATGVIQFNDVVGSTPLNILDMTASQININTPWINTMSDQNYNGPVVLMTNVDFSGLGMRSISGVVTYNSTLNGDGNGPWNVAITGTEIRFKGNIGTANPLNALNVNADVINFDGGVTTITTLGTQTYTGATLMSMNADPVFTAPSFVINIPVLINANTTYNSTAGDIDFQSTVDGDGVSSLILNPVGGSAIFRAEVGFGTALGSLSVNGTTSVNGATIIQTNGNQIYSDTVTLNNSVTMNTLVNGNIQYNGGGVVDAGANTLTASSANTAQGPVGHGITGKVNVTNLTLSGPGGANLSENYPVSESFVGGQGGQQARTNTIAPPNVEGVVIYCVNGFNCTPAPTPTNNIPNNIPQLQVFNLLNGLQVCDSSGCSNLAVIFDDVAEAGTVNCVVGFAQIMDQAGQKRIAFPGVSIYAGESIVADAGSQVCIKNLDGKMECKTAPK